MTLFLTVAGKGEVCVIEHTQNEETHNSEAFSNNHCCASAVSTRYSDFVFVAVVIQHEKRLRLIAFSSLYQIFPRYLINGTIFGKLS